MIRLGLAIGTTGKFSVGWTQNWPSAQMQINHAKKTFACKNIPEDIKIVTQRRNMSTPKTLPGGSKNL